MRMPPIFTNSAVTPAFFMPLIFSTSAGGNVFSIPKRIPIFLFAIIRVLLSVPLWTSKAPVSPLQILLLKIFLRHPLPQRPVVLAVIAVDVQPMRNALGVENRRHLHVRVQAH